MPIPLAVLAATASVPAIAQGITGFQQSRRGKDILNNLVRPTYNVPTAQTEALGTARTLASSNQLPNQVQAEQRLDQATANALYNINQNAGSGTEALAALTGVYSNQMGAENELAGQSAMFANQQNQNLINELNKFAMYQDKAFDYNVNQPFQEARAEGQALIGAGMQNKFNALKDVAGVAANAMLGANAQKMGLQDKVNNLQLMTKPNPFGTTKSVSDTLGGGSAVSNLTGSYDPSSMPKELQDFASSFEMSQQKSIFNPNFGNNNNTLTKQQIDFLLSAIQGMNK